MTSAPSNKPFRHDLSRFHEAQEGRGPGSSFDIALAEIRQGRKKNHWMWYVFPQLRLGTSDHSVKYAINGADEAIAYLNDPVLRNRLLEIALATAEQLAAGADPDSLMGGNADCTKLRSSMTLFDVASASCGDEEIREVCRRVLELLAATGIGPCPMTLKMLADPYIS